MDIVHVFASKINFIPLLNRPVPEYCAQQIARPQHFDDDQPQTARAKSEINDRQTISPPKRLANSLTT
jgi:hypothetical protein